MVAQLIRFVSTAATALVVAGFGLFAVDEWREGSRAQVARLQSADRPAPTPSGERAREREQSGLREAIDDANDVLLAPFTGVVATSGSAWARHGVPALLAFVSYGFLLRLLANALPTERAREPSGWQRRAEAPDYR